MNAPIHSKVFDPAMTIAVRDPASGQFLPLKGYGSMRGVFEVKGGIDLTKPIAAQVRKSGHGTGNKQG